MADRLQVNFPPYVEIFTGHKVNMVGKFYPIRSAIVDNDAKGISVLKESVTVQLTKTDLRRRRARTTQPKSSWEML